MSPVRADLSSRSVNLDLHTIITCGSWGVNDHLGQVEWPRLSLVADAGDGSLGAAFVCVSPTVGVGEATFAVANNDHCYSKGSTVHELPPPPDGDVLCLSGALTLGCCGALRRARGYLTSALPQWYHSANHRQIGHAVAFTFDRTASPVRAFESLPVPSDPLLFSSCLRRESASDPESQSTLQITAPRAPPV